MNQVNGAIRLNRAPIIGRSVVPPELLPETQITNQVLELIERHADRDFMITASWSPPHDLWVIPEPYYSMVDRNAVKLPGSFDMPAWDQRGPSKRLGDILGRKGVREYAAIYHGMVKYIDDQVGRVLKKLEELNLAEKTLVIFTTDHGYAMPRAKCSLYDPGIAVAFMLRLPAREGWYGGAVKTEMISNIDYLPSILELLDIPIPEDVQGRSFAPLLDGRAYEARDAIFAEMSHHDYYDPRRCVRTATHKLIVNFSSAPLFMDPSQSWRPRSDTVAPDYQPNAYHDCVELYDLAKDPFELNDVSYEADYADCKKGLLRRLQRHLTETDDPILKGAITPPLHEKSLALLREAGA